MTYDTDPVEEAWKHIVDEIGTGGVADLVEAAADDAGHAAEIYDYITDAILPSEGE